MKRNHARWLTAIITTALLLLGAGLPAKAQFPIVNDPAHMEETVTQARKDFEEFRKQAERFTKQTQEWASLYSKVSDLISAGNAVLDAAKALEDLSKIPDAVIRQQRDNKFLYDFEKLRCIKQTTSLMKQGMNLVSDLRKIAGSDNSVQMSQGDRYSLVKELSDKVVALRNKAYQIVGYYNKLSQSRSQEATTQRLFDQLNGYK